jgi:glycine oxidase
VNSWDAIIVGAGIIGVSTAWELRQRGARVLLLERGEPGREASSAAAGMLAACDPETPVALRRFARECARVYPQFVNILEGASGMAVDFRRQGTITLEDNHGTLPQEYRKLDKGELRRLEPLLDVHGRQAFFVAEDCVDPDLVMQAAVRSATLAGVAIKSSVTMQEMRAGAGQVEVVTSAGSFFAKTAVNCCGAWSGAPVKPRKGHMLYVQPKRAGLLQHVFRAPDSYIVPRSSGKVLLGTTLEDAGFDKAVDKATIEKLRAAAVRYVPELADAPVTTSWTGLRPGSPDDLPIMGGTEIPGVFVASGHFRNGILLAPLTAQIMANLAMGQPAGMDISAFSPARFAVKGA